MDLEFRIYDIFMRYDQYFYNKIANQMLFSLIIR